MSENDVKAYAEWEDNRLKSISNMIVEYFPRSMMFHFIIVSMVCVRAPTDFAVSATLFAMLMRIIMVFGYYANKKAVYISASAMEIFINFILLFICMGYKPPEAVANASTTL